MKLSNFTKKFFPSALSVLITLLSTSQALASPDVRFEVGQHVFYDKPSDENLSHGIIEEIYEISGIGFANVSNHNSREKVTVWLHSLGLSVDRYAEFHIGQRVICLRDGKEPLNGETLHLFDKFGAIFEEDISKKSEFCSYRKLKFKNQMFDKFKPGTRVAVKKYNIPPYLGVVDEIFSNGLVSINLDSGQKKEIIHASVLSYPVDNLGIFKPDMPLYHILISGVPVGVIEEVFSNGLVLWKSSLFNEQKLFNAWTNKYYDIFRSF